MANENKKKFRVNAFDVVVIVLILLVLAAAYFLIHSRSGQAETTTVRYVVELTNLTEGSDELVSVGDSMQDNVKNYAAGTVVEKETLPSLREVTNLETKSIQYVPVDGYCTLHLTLEADAVVSDSSIETSEGFLIRTGESVSLTTGQFFGSGYIIQIER